MPAARLLPEVLAGLLREAATRFLRLAPDSPRYLEPLSGKVVCLNFTPPGFRLYVCPDAASLDILPSFGGAPDVTLSGSPLAFARMGLSDSPRRALFAGEIIVEGDTAVAQRFQMLFERLEIGWEGFIARFTGQALAARLAFDWRAFRDWGRDSVDALRMNVAEYLQEESRDLPAAPEAEAFYADVDTLRADFDRLEARLSRLEKLCDGC